VKKVDVEIYTLSDKVSATQEVRVNGVKVRIFGAKSISDGIKIPSHELTNALEKSDADIIHLHGFHSLLPYYVLKARSNLEHKLVMTPHYHGIGHSFLRNILFRFYKPTLRKMANYSNKIISVSSYEKSLILRDFGVDNEKVVIIPNGISFEGINRLYPTQKDKNKILSVGRLEKYKNFDKVIRAMKLLADTHFSLTIIGDGPERSKLLDLIRKLELNNKVFLKSNLTKEELFFEYANSSFFVLPSYYEAYGIAVAEAQSLGLNVIVSNAGALSEFIAGNYAYGITLPVTPEKIAHTIIEASRGVKPIDKYVPYTWDKAVEELMQLYESLI